MFQFYSSSNSKKVQNITRLTIELNQFDGYFIMKYYISTYIYIYIYALFIVFWQFASFFPRITTFKIVEDSFYRTYANINGKRSDSIVCLPIVRE